MIEKIKFFFESRKTYNLVSKANDYNVIKPFLHGTLIENRRFGKYIFVKNSNTNKLALEKRNFKDFKEIISNNVDWGLNDEIFDIVADTIQYNTKYNIMIAMVPEKIWDILNIAINIAENTTQDIPSQRSITINACRELLPEK
jgi:hypothetical protein